MFLINCTAVNPPICCSSELSATVEEAIYASDEFRMYAFKIKRCPKTRAHDWTECPFAHRGEKARRRDPRRFNYVAIACPEFRHGECRMGEACGFAHGVFEYWLHPARYRTRACNAGHYCRRKVCFFAHTPEQLRSRTHYRCHYAYRVCMEAPKAAVLMPGLRKSLRRSESEEFLEILRKLEIGEGGGERPSGWGISDISDMDLPHVGWISELVE
ncbi:zinc finger CCCH domain-containing protein 54 isoform X2 [Malania oleifera]|uniref:zinc finger CCCH domain-containing protein 54 isoform X2 n=1 Tax=Malania oleifera TaxID=397392 RepID=UPI0025ADA346|nr:zinc finger CCCH domain-containing protein 54 isoform X2 [Malania oleifera]